MVMVSAPSGDVYYGALVAGPIFKEVADKIYSTSLDIHKDLNSELLTTNVPKTKGGSGADIKKIFSDLRIPSAPLVDADWILTSQKDSTVTFHSSRIKEELKSGSMPDVTGMGIRDALYLLENAGLTVRALGRGTVKKQSLPPGVKFVKGTAVTIELS
jgi:cell division protein FtsI (penicillin-binding protein 3)